jgi:adenylate cyclase
MEDLLPRKLAAILYADVAGYSRLTGEDEDATHRILTEYLDLISTTIESHHGQVKHYAGDAVLAKFDAVVDAMSTAVTIQDELKTRNETVPDNRKIRFRIGVNLGDVIEDRGDIYGDGVNIAARLESLAKPGGICISDAVRSAVGRKLDLDYEDMGEQEVKNISEPVRTYRVVIAGRKAPDAIEPSKTALELPEKPSIAVLPFQNMSGDSEQEFFADGMAEEVITALSHYRWFFVIARNSSFTYKNRAVDVTKVGKELGVQYVLEGSVRKAGNRVRVTAQLIDAMTGTHIWAERYDRELDDIFALQAELGAFERERVRRKPPENLDAWGSFQRGLWHFFSYQTRDGLAEAKRQFERACKLDPGFATAYAELAWTHIADIHRGFANDPEVSLEQAASAAEKALALDPRDPVAHFAAGRVHIFKHAHDSGIAEMETALELNPNSDRAHYCLGLALLYAGRPDASIPHLESAIRLNPRSPISWAYYDMLGRAFFNLGNYEEAAVCLYKATQQPNASFLPFVHSAATLGHLGRIDEARRMLAEGKKRQPDFSADTVESTVGVYGQYSGADQIIDGLRKAGLPE